MILDMEIEDTSTIAAPTKHIKDEAMDTSESAQNAQPQVEANVNSSKTTTIASLDSLPIYLQSTEES